MYKKVPILGAFLLFFFPLQGSSDVCEVSTGENMYVLFVYAEKLVSYYAIMFTFFVLRVSCAALLPFFLSSFLCMLPDAFGV